MAIRYAVQADSKQECADGLTALCEALGYIPAMTPRQLTDDRWMARAVPAPPTEEPEPAAPGA
jgi:hypothetical protein